MTMHSVIVNIDTALRTLFNVGTVSRPNPSGQLQSKLTKEQVKHAAGLMRVNHVGEVCAQALYTGQAFAARSEDVRRFNKQSALEEVDHLLWCKQRLDELNAKPSLLNPLWYASAYTIGVVAGFAGDKVSLGFVKETENQVAKHLLSHLSLLPESDERSRAIVQQMKTDEIDHAQQAQRLGAIDLPKPVTFVMRLSAKVMTSTAYRL